MWIRMDTWTGQRLESSSDKYRKSSIKTEHNFTMNLNLMLFSTNLMKTMTDFYQNQKWLCS